MPKSPNVKDEPEPTPTPQSGPFPTLRDESDFVHTQRNQQTFGQKAVGLFFNPSGDATVNELKNLYAQIIDICHARRGSLMQGSEAHRLYAIAITEAQGAQMWAVKAQTWVDK